MKHNGLDLLTTAARPGPMPNVKEEKVSFAGLSVRIVDGATRRKEETAGNYLNLLAGLTARAPPILTCGTVCR